MGDRAQREGTRRIDRSSGGAFQAFSVRHFGSIYTVGVIWSVCRWGLGFLAAYVVFDLTESPRLVQLTGTAMWAPLLFAGVIGGTVSDRFDRRTLLLAQFAVLGPLTLGVGVLAASDRLAVWVIYPYMVVIGIGWVMDMTVRRAWVHDLVGDGPIDNAMAFEQLGSSLGLAAGALAGGAIIEFVGTSAAYFATAGVILVAALLVLPVPGSGTPLVQERPPFVAELREGFRALKVTPILVSILGVTLLVNFFHFSYFPIVPVIAERVGADAFRTGLLAAATGFGMSTGAMLVIWRQPPRGRAYCLGAAGGFVLLVGFAIFTSYWLVFASVYLASTAIGGFGSTQSALVLTSASERLRGRAMGLLSMAIGGLPVGMYLLGEFAEAFGAPAAVIVSNVAGLSLLGIFLRRRPEVWRTR